MMPNNNNANNGELLLALLFYIAFIAQIHSKMLKSSL